MPKCSNCSKPQSKLNKGALCKECFNNKINKTVCNETIEPVFESEAITGTIDDDRYLVDIMKDYMMRERELKDDLIKHLKEEVLYLKDELLHKNILIDRLFADSNSCNENYRNNDGMLPTCSERITTNDVLIETHRITISPDDSLCTNGISYNNIEKDDVLLGDNNNGRIKSSNLHHHGNKRLTKVNDNRSTVEHPDDYLCTNSLSYKNIEKDDVILDNNNSTRFNSSKLHHGNKSVINVNYNKNTVEHPNRFNALCNEDDDAVSDNNNYETNYDVELMNGNIARKQDRATEKNRTRPHVITQDYPENNYVNKPIRPGVNTYSEATKDGKVTVIFSTSITKGINVREFNKHYKMGIARFRRFHGAKAKYIKHYVIPTLVDENPKVVLLQCGGNDLPTSRNNPTPVEDIAKNIIETAQVCENFGAEHIFIGSITTRTQGYVDRRRIKLNEILREMCYDAGYNFVDNDNITHDHLFQDGVHLNYEGNDILTNNFLHSLNNYY